VDLTGARWRKSSFSGENGSGSGCVEVAFLSGGRVAVRDTKDRSRPPHTYTPHQWSDFLAAVRAGEFDTNT
jgi:Domain of unknown function (DUF397)